MCHGLEWCVNVTANQHVCTSAYHRHMGTNVSEFRQVLAGALAGFGDGLLQMKSPPVSKEAALNQPGMIDERSASVRRTTNHRRALVSPYDGV
jgi:hypothetical protein